MKIYGIVRDYEGFDFDNFFINKEDAELYLIEMLRDSGKEDYSDEYSVQEIEVK
jgi:hypothetical protein